MLEVSTTLLKECAAAGLTLSEIGLLCTRPLSGMEEEPSQLEQLCAGARAAMEVQGLFDDAGASSSDDGDWCCMEGVEEEDEEEPGTPGAHSAAARGLADSLVFNLEEEEMGARSSADSSPKVSRGPGGGCCPGDSERHAYVIRVPASPRCAPTPLNREPASLSYPTPVSQSHCISHFAPNHSLSLRCSDLDKVIP